MKSIFNYTSILTKVLLFGFILFSGCEKDDSVMDDISIDDPNDPNDDPNDDPNNSTGRFSDYITCSIIGTPSALGLNPTYTKFINCSGVAVVGSSNVSDQALIDADAIIQFMLTGIGASRSKLITGDAYAIIYEEGMVLGDVPEVPSSVPSSASGTYIGQLNLLVSAEYDLLCNHDYGSTGGNTFIHEFAHMLDFGAIRKLDNGFATSLSSSYSSARSNGLWDNTYAASHQNEYFAEGVTIWYGENWIGPEGGDGFRNEIGTRAQLQDYDSSLYNLIAGKLNNLTAVPGCREPVILGATADCPNTITDIDGNVYEIVNIGPMCWMKENLRTTRYKDGSPILNLQSNNDWMNTSNGAWSHYDNDPNLDNYGKLYNGHAATNPAGLCPEGWHVPSIQELSDLTQYAGGENSGKELRAMNVWNLPDDTNSTGFSALPSGFREYTGSFGGMGGFTIYVSTTFNGNQDLYSKEIASGDYVGYFGRNPNTGYSCRCIKD